MGTAIPVVTVAAVVAVPDRAVVSRAAIWAARLGEAVEVVVVPVGVDTAAAVGVMGAAWVEVVVVTVVTVVRTGGAMLVVGDPSTLGFVAAVTDGTGEVVPESATVPTLPSVPAVVPTTGDAVVVVALTLFVEEILPPGPSKRA